MFLATKFITRQLESRGSFQIPHCWWTCMTMQCFSLLAQVQAGIGLCS